MNDPKLGVLEFDHLTFLTPIAPDLHVKVFVALPETGAKLKQFLSSSPDTVSRSAKR